MERFLDRADDHARYQQRRCDGADVVDDDVKKLTKANFLAACRVYVDM